MSELSKMRDAARQNEPVRESLKDRFQKFENGEVDNISISGDEVAGGDMVEGSVKQNVLTDTETSSDIPAGDETSLIEMPVDEESMVPEITITPSDKKRFLHAILYDTRFTEDFSLMNGTLKGVFQSKTIVESGFIVDEISRRIKDKVFRNDTEYYHTVRCLALAVHVKRFNGTNMYDDEEITEERIMQNFEWWAARDIRNPAGQVVLYDKVREFERKYLAMLEAGRDENFWETGESF